MRNASLVYVCNYRSECGEEMWHLLQWQPLFEQRREMCRGKFDFERIRGRIGGNHLDDVGMGDVAQDDDASA